MNIFKDKDWKLIYFQRSRKLYIYIYIYIYIYLTHSWGQGQDDTHFDYEYILNSDRDAIEREAVVHVCGHLPLVGPAWDVKAVACKVARWHVVRSARRQVRFTRTAHICYSVLFVTQSTRWWLPLHLAYVPRRITDWRRSSPRRRQDRYIDMRSGRTISVLVRTPRTPTLAQIFSEPRSRPLFCERLRVYCKGRSGGWSYSRKYSSGRPYSSRFPILFVDVSRTAMTSRGDTYAAAVCGRLRRSDALGGLEYICYWVALM